MTLGTSAESGQDRVPDHRVAVYREHDAQVAVRGRDAGQRAADRAQRVTPRLPPVRGDQQHRGVVGIQPGQRRFAEAGLARDGPQQGVDDRVPGHHDAGLVDVLGEQIGLAGTGRGEMQRREPGGQPAVDLLGVRREGVARAQPGFQMHHRDLLVEGGQRGGEHGGRIALHHHRVRALLRQHRPHPGQGAGGDLGERLPRPVDIQVKGGLDVEDRIHLVEHRPVLCGHRDDRGEHLRAVQRLDQRRDLDRFRPGPVDDHDLTPAGRRRCRPGAGVGM